MNPTRNARRYIFTMAAAWTVFILLAGMAAAAGLPKTVAWTAYSVKSSGYAQSAAIGDAMAKAEGITLRVIPAGNDIARMAPLRSGKAHFSAMGSGSYLAQEGVSDFASEQWGPQPLRLVLASWADTNTGNVATAKDANIRTMADLKGKRVAWVIGGAALNANMTGFMAFGNVTWDDVEKVEFPGWSQSMKGLVNGQVDAAIASTASPPTFELDASPRGIFWPETPAGDKAGWKRFKGKAPWFNPHNAIAGSGGISKDNPHHGGSYGYPILVTYSKMASGAVYHQAKLIDTTFDIYKGAHPGAKGWAIDRQSFDWMLPYHEGAIRYFKEIGVWNSRFQKTTDRLIKRQAVLQKAWARAKSEMGGKDGFRAHWMKTRAAMLKSAGMDPIWEK